MEEGIWTYCNILAWRILWTERSLAGYSPQGPTESDTTEVTLCVYTRAHTHTHTQTYTED